MAITKHKRKVGRPAIHGGYVFLKSNLISKDNKHITKYLSAIRANYIEELGPTEDDLSTGQTVLLGQLITCVGFCRLVEEKARKLAELRPIQTKQYMSFMKHGRQLVLDLGLKPDRQEKPVFLEDM